MSTLILSGCPNDSEDDSKKDYDCIKSKDPEIIAANVIIIFFIFMWITPLVMLVNTPALIIYIPIAVLLSAGAGK